MNNVFMGYGGGFGSSMWAPAHGALIVLVVLLWSLFWKGLALWHSARRNQPWWFAILLVLNTVGILEIVYLFAVLKLKFSDLFSKK